MNDARPPSSFGGSTDGNGIYVTYAAAKRTIYTATYHGGLLPNYLLVDNTAGSAPIVVKLQATTPTPSPLARQAATSCRKT